MYTENAQTVGNHFISLVASLNLDPTITTPATFKLTVTKQEDILANQSQVEPQTNQTTNSETIEPAQTTITINYIINGKNLTVGLESLYPLQPGFRLISSEAA